MKDESNRKPTHIRIIFIGGFFAVFYMIVLARAYQLQILGNSQLNQLVNSQYTSKVLIQPKRGTILDRNGEPLAMDILTASVGVHPHRVTDKQKAQLLLTKYTGVPEKIVAQKLQSKKKFEWIERRIPLKQGDALSELEQDGIQIVHEYRRYYPNKSLAGQLLGAVGYDAKALGGIESDYDDLLKSESQKTSVEKDARGRLVSIRKEGEDPFDLMLTIDKTIQHIAEEALTENAIRHRVKNGSAVVMDVHSGEILALANYPPFNPNRYWSYPQEHWKNRAVTDLFEPGSVFKTFLIAAALESGKVKPEDKFFCENGSYRVGNKVIQDHGKTYGWLTTAEILQVSSNIGVTKIAQKIGKKTFYETIKNFGFGELTGIGLKGEAQGVVRDYKSWQEIELSNIAFGQGISTTGLQMITAYGAIGNGGVPVRPQVVKKILHHKNEEKFSPETGKTRQALSQKTANALKNMLHKVTQPGGTAPQAHLPHYLAAGKTGTAQKVDPQKRAYSEKDYLSSFIGFAPLHDPKVVVAVIYDTPTQGSHYGGTVAGPVFKKVALDTLAYLGEIPPKKNETQLAKIPLPPPEKMARENGKKAVPFETGMMPDLEGTSLRELLKLTQRHDIKLKVRGSGFVQNQSPKAGEKFEKNWQITLAGEW